MVFRLKIWKFIEASSKKSAGMKNYAALFVVRKILQPGILLKWQKYCLCAGTGKIATKITTFDTLFL